MHTASHNKADIGSRTRRFISVSSFNMLQLRMLCLPALPFARVLWLNPGPTQPLALGHMGSAVPAVPPRWRAA